MFPIGMWDVECVREGDVSCGKGAQALPGICHSLVDFILQIYTLRRGHQPNDVQFCSLLTILVCILFFPVLNLN